MIATAASGSAEALAVALDRLGVRHGSIGLDESRLTPEAWAASRLRCRVSRSWPLPAIWPTARRVKAPYEIECLGHALRIAEEALDAVIQALDRGMTEREAATLFTTEVIKRGGWPRLPLVTHR